MATLTRDGLGVWLAALAALVAYLLADGRPPTLWDYRDWLKFVAAAVGWLAGKLGSSPLPSTAEVADDTVTVTKEHHV